VCGCRHYLELTRDDFWVFLGMAWGCAASALLWHVRS
jgi:hypothetical protein